MTTSPCVRTSALFITLALWLVPVVAAADEALTCSSADGRGHHHYFLDGDLDCSGAPIAAIQLYRGDRIEMNGYTISHASITAAGSAKIIGPGTIASSPGDGVRHQQGTLKLREVTITDSAWNGVSSFAGVVRLVDSHVTDNAGDGVAARKKIIVDDSTVTDNGRFGLTTLLDSACSTRARIKLKSSTATGNGTDAQCGATVTCADVASCALPPKLKESTCDHSYVIGSGFPGDNFGVCTGD